MNRKSTTVMGTPTSRSRAARAALLFSMGSAISGFTTIGHAAVPAGERQALLSFYNATNGAGWGNKTGWLGAPGTECSWFGVVCDQNQNHVVGLQLAGNQLTGPMSNIASLTELQDIELGGNLLTGPISDLTPLHQLQTFSVHNNALKGPFPSFAGSAPLQLIDVSFNALSGPIPPVAGIPTLVWIFVDGNLFSGPLPDLAGLSNLSGLSAENDQLTGSIPPLDGLSALTIFDVSRNNLIGDIPSIAMLPALNVFDVSNNQLTGSLPLGYPAGLQSFRAASNALSGNMAPLGSAPIELYQIGGNPQLSGQVGAPPVPNTLHNTESWLCPSGLVASNDSQVNAEWDAATGHTPWDSNCAQQQSEILEPDAWLTFDPPNVAQNGDAVMTITVTNTNAQPLTGIAFSDAYPAGITNAAAPIRPVQANTCGAVGSVVALQGGNSTTLTGGSLQPHASCVIQVRVVGSVVGSWSDTTGSVTSNESIAGASGPGVLIVTAADHPPTPQDDQIEVQAFGSTDAIVGDSRVPSSLLDNDTDPDPGDYVAKAVIATNPVCGNLTLHDDGTFSYQSTTDQCTTDTFQYKACDTYQQCSLASAHITITSQGLLQAPTVQETFTPEDVYVGELSAMSITLTNHDPNNAMVGVQFADVYPANLSNAYGGPIPTNTCGGSLIVLPFGASATLTGGTIPSGQSCVVTISVIGTSAGTAENHTGPVTATNALAGAEGVAVLEIADTQVASPLVTKVFTPDHVVVGGDPSLMTITILNNDDEIWLTHVAFTDNYPQGMVNAANAALVNTCGDMGTLTAEPGGTSVTLHDGVVAANSWCYVKIQIVGTSPGSLENHTGPVTSANASPGVSATARLIVDAAAGTTPQTIAFTSTAPVSGTVAGPVYSASANASSGLPVVLTIDAPSATVCTISSGTVSFIGAGTCTIDANQGGDATYGPAPQVQQSIPVVDASGVRRKRLRLPQPRRTTP